MNKDAELERWQHQWREVDQRRGDEEPHWAAALRSRVRTQTRRTFWGMLAPIVITLAFGAALLNRGARGGRLDVAIAVEGLGTMALFWLGCLYLARGTWRPFRESTAEFVDLAIRRAEGNLKIARLGLWFLLAQLTFGSALYWFMTRSEPANGSHATSWPLVLWACAGLPAYLAWLQWYDRRQRRKLQDLASLKGQLRNDAL